jgi:outer membrane protein assembly factor BamB
MGHWRLKDDAIIAVLTTRCSSAFALIASCWVVVSAQSPAPRPHPTPSPSAAKADRTLPSLFPIEPAWTLALNNPLTVAPAYDERQVYFPIEGDRLVAYDIASGKQEWIATVQPLMTPVAGGGLVFVVQPGTLTALYATVGWVAWQIPLTEKLAVPPVWDNGWLIVASEQGEVGALRAVDGELIWRRDIKSPAHALPALAADRVYVPTTDNRIVALRIDNGEPIWERRLGGAPNEMLAVGDRLYAGSTDNFFYCMMTRDGRIDWRWRTGADAIGAPVFHDGRVFFVALDNVLRALNHRSGSQEWMRPLPIRPAWGPVLAGSTVIVGGLAPALRGFDIKDGKPAGEVPAGGEVGAAPHAFIDPRTKTPMLVIVTHDIAKGAGAVLAGRSFEPAITPVSPLPNLITMTPTTSPAPR